MGTGEYLQQGLQLPSSRFWNRVLNQRLLTMNFGTTVSSTSETSARDGF